MWSKHRALLREHFMENRAPVLAGAIPSIMYAVAFTGHPERLAWLYRVGLDPEPALIVPWLTFAGVVLFLLSHKVGEEYRLDFPRRQFVLPVSTSALVSIRFWHVLFWAWPLSLIIRFVGESAFPLNTTYVWYVTPHPIFMAILVAWLFAVTCLATSLGQWVSPVIGMAPLAVAYSTAGAFNEFIEGYEGNTGLLFAAIFVIGVVPAWLVSIALIHYARHGAEAEGLGWMHRTGLGAKQRKLSEPGDSRKPLERPLAISFPWFELSIGVHNRHAHFATPLGAQAWFEWRRCARYIVWSTIPCLICCAAYFEWVVGSRFSGGSFRLDGSLGAVVLLFLPLVFAGGVYLLLCNKHYLTFVATKPLPKGAIAHGKLLAGALATAASSLIWILFVGLTFPGTSIEQFAPALVMMVILFWTGLMIGRLALVLWGIASLGLYVVGLLFEPFFQWLYQQEGIIRAVAMHLLPISLMVLVPSFVLLRIYFARQVSWVKALLLSLLVCVALTLARNLHIIGLLSEFQAVCLYRAELAALIVSCFLCSLIVGQRGPQRLRWVLAAVGIFLLFAGLNHRAALGLTFPIPEISFTAITFLSYYVGQRFHRWSGSAMSFVVVFLVLFAATAGGNRSDLFTSGTLRFSVGSFSMLLSLGALLLFMGIVWRMGLVTMTCIRNSVTAFFLLSFALICASIPLQVLAPITSLYMSSIPVAICLAPFAWVPLVVHLQRHR